MFSRTIELHVEALALLSSRESTSALAFLDGNDPTELSRFSFLGVRPVERRSLRRQDDLATFFRALESRPAVDGGWLTEGLHERQLPRWIGHVAYDLVWSRGARLGVRKPQVHPRSAPLEAHFDRFDALLVSDRRLGQVHAVAESEAALEQLLSDVQSLRRAPQAGILLGPVQVEDPDPHARAIERALAHIADGDLYQINLARAWRARFEGTPHPARALARAMRKASPVPFGALLEAPDGSALVARTMETFLRWDRTTRRLSTRPIKGTRSRLEEPDLESQERLRSDTKERAEHAMIVDLMRNDLGRLAETGSVRVIEPFAVEPYARLFHLVSTVEAITREGTTLEDVMEATFPPGSVTGTPKLAAIECIEALEREPRGAYTGCVGYVDRSGGLSLAVAIRTAQLSGGEVRYFAGGGIVDASIVAREVAETELKALVFTEVAKNLAAGVDDEGVGP